MVALTAVAIFAAIAAFCFLAAACGRQLLRWLCRDGDETPENLLYAIALGVVCLEIGFFLVLAAGTRRLGIIIALVLAAVVGIREFKIVVRSAAAAIAQIRASLVRERLLAATVALVLLIEGIAALAPLTGSDALHYHFAYPRWILLHGLHPDFFITNSFLTGQGHLLIFSGLALGSERLALGLVFLGGVLAAAACAVLAHKWAPGIWPWLAALTFLFTPVAFWQISTSGAPDIWMAFFAPVGVLAIADCAAHQPLRAAILAGALAGACAGAKYTGCIIAAGLTIAFIWQTRSVRRFGIFISAALTVGVWPYLRNWVWTGDPVFPFLLNRFAPKPINAYAPHRRWLTRAQAGIAASWELSRSHSLPRSTGRTRVSGSSSGLCAWHFLRCSSWLCEKHRFGALQSPCGLSELWASGWFPARPDLFSPFSP